MKNLAIVSGVLGFVLFVLTPFLPVTQTQSTIDWPQDTNLRSVNAPLISYAPQDIEMTVPVGALKHLHEGQTTVLSTLPEDSSYAVSRGLFVRLSQGGMDVAVRDKVPFELTHQELEALPDSAVLKVKSTHESTSVEVPGQKNSKGEPLKGTTEGDERPQVSGVYTELDANPELAQKLTNQGLKVHVNIDSRFTSSPTVIKYVAMFAGVLLTLVSLWCLHKMDVLDGRKHHRILPARWWHFSLLDAIVAGVLIIWYFIGANTSDDGYLLTMARLADPGTYMANYYRWYGVPESPFGSPYYDLLAALTHVSATSTWMRLPSLLAALLTWAMISREVLPRLGTKINQRRVAHWTAALVFLSFWMAFNNGLRPEPVIAAGALLTWISIERSIATSRLLPAAIGVIVATLSLGAGPTGLMAVAALLAGLSSLVRILIRRLPLLGAPLGKDDEGSGQATSRGKVLHATLAMLAPFLAAGTAILVCVFGDQTLASVKEAIRVRGYEGPSFPWYQEWTRYQVLATQTVDGSLARRLPVMLVFASLALVIGAMLKRGRVLGSAPGPSARLVFMMVGTMFFMMFTPTKWTHHFGVYAGIGAAFAALAAVALSHLAVRSVRNRTITFGAFLFLFAFALSGINGWWYVSSFSVPWYDKTIQYKGVEASYIVLAIALITLAIGALQSFISDVRTAKADAEGTLDELNRKRRLSSRRFIGLASSPIALVSALMVALNLLSLGKAFAAQYPAYSVGLGNVRSVTGKGCQLADDVMVETNSNDAFLSPADGSELGKSLESEDNRGFKANNVPSSISTDPSATPQGGGTGTAGSVSTSSNPNGGNNDDNTTSAGDSNVTAGQETGSSGGTRRETGVNGSKAKLPFGLDYAKVPVLGSYTDGDQYPAEVTTTWYSLPKQKENAPLLVISAAGRIDHHDLNGVHQYGQKLKVQYGTRGADGKVTNQGEIEPIDIGPDPSWRNLRVPMEKIPGDANVVRIRAVDNDLYKDQWLAFTPPRIPQLDTLNNVVGRTSPGLLDWSTALQFPCQQPYRHHAGVAEIPEWRISPDHAGKGVLSAWMNYTGGGSLGVAESVNSSTEVPTYLKGNWGRDWGSLEKYHLRKNSRGDEPVKAKVDHQDFTRSGVWSPGKMKIED